MGGSPLSGTTISLSVVVPTRDEKGNVGEFVRRLERAVDRTSEAVFVDDSDDETPSAIRAVASESRIDVRLIHRPPEERGSGLSGAVVEGLRKARGSWVCVMDGDLQHPPELVRSLLERGRAGDVDLVVASRYCDGRDPASTAQLGPRRRRLSAFLTRLTRACFPRRLRDVSDPLSGFFLVRRERIDPEALRPRGFKVLLDLLVRTPGLRVAEVPFATDERRSGESKASLREGMQFLRLLAGLRLGAVSMRFGRFALVGLSGLFVNTAVLYVLVEAFGFHYLTGAIVATQFSTLWNFVLTEAWVFTDRKHRWSVGVRMAMFFLLNNVAFVVRGPLLVVFVAAFGLNYLLANLLSLVTLTVIRYAIADVWIWRRRGDLPALEHRYDIHGLVRIDSEVRLPELERFRTVAPRGPPTICVRIGRLNERQSNLIARLAFLVRHARYDEGLGRFGFALVLGIGKQTEVLASPLLRRSPHVLYTNVVEPILRWAFVNKGYALVHGACIARESNAVLVTARTDTGKTTTVLRTLSAGSYDFLADDLTLLSRDGHVLSYPKPLTISRHTLHAANCGRLTRGERLALVPQSRIHSRSGRQFARLLLDAGLPVATINALVQMVVPPPKYDIERLLPSQPIATDAKLIRVAVIEPGGDASIPIDARGAAARLMENTADAFEFPPYETVERFIADWDSNDLKEAEKAIVEDALANVPAAVLRSDTMDWWRKVQSLVEEPSDAAKGNGHDRAPLAAVGRAGSSPSFPESTA